MPFETAPLPRDQENYQCAGSSTMEMQLPAQTFLTHLISAECCFPDPEGKRGAAFNGVTLMRPLGGLPKSTSFHSDEISC